MRKARSISLVVIALQLALLCSRFGTAFFSRHASGRVGRSSRHFYSSRFDPAASIVPSGGSVYTSLSFFRFLPIADVESIVKLAKEALVSLGVRGTLLISTEGVNGQFAVPPELVQSLGGELASLFGQPLDLNLGNTVDYSQPDTLCEFPFKRLIVRQKRQVLTDNLDLPLDCADAGPELSPSDWHRALAEQQGPSGGEAGEGGGSVLAPVVLDCRNSYESEVGGFTGALPLNTDVFSQSWAALDELLKDTPRDAPILTYCTGGIRCVKVNAYLRQRMGFTNTHRLQKGIVAYEQWANAEGQEEEQQEEVAVEMVRPGQQQSLFPSSLFEGENFVFDKRRMARDPEGVEQREQWQVMQAQVRL